MTENLNVEVIQVARNSTISDFVLACAKKELKFDELCRLVHKMGYNTNSLFEMVIATEKCL
jgi:hypothetical protein